MTRQAELTERELIEEECLCRRVWIAQPKSNPNNEDKQWEVRKEEADRATKDFPTREEAWERAKEIARNEATHPKPAGARLKKSSDGQFAENRFYPHPNQKDDSTPQQQETESERQRDEEPSRRLTKKGAMVSENAYKRLKHEDVDQIENMEYLPMYVNAHFLDLLRDNKTDDVSYENVIVKSELPKFKDVDMNEVDASEEGDIISVPKANSEILVNRGSAERVSGSKLVEFIDSLDDGDGADYKEVINNSSYDEEDIEALKAEGRVYEPYGGKLKVLDMSDPDSKALNKKEVFDKLNDRDYDKFHEGAEVYAFNHKETNQDLWIEGKEKRDKYIIYGDIVNTLRHNDVISSTTLELRFDSKEDALDELKLVAMHFNNNYEDYLEGYGDEEDSLSTQERNNAEKEVLSIIEQNDSGEGTEVSVVMNQASVSRETVEEVINSLLSEGTLYEPRPEYLKKL